MVVTYRAAYSDRSGDRCVMVLVYNSNRGRECCVMVTDRAAYSDRSGDRCELVTDRAAYSDRR